MSWLFSQALVEEFLGDICSDGEPSAPLNGNPMPQAYLPPDRMTAFLRPSRFGMTFSPLTEDHGAALLTSYLAGFRAKTSASQAGEPASTVPAAECGDTWRGSLARFDPATSSWRTAQRSLLGDSDESSVIWPRSGMTADGQCWELPTLEHRTSGTGSGLLPTPTTQNNVQIRGQGAAATHGKRGTTLAGWVSMWPTPRASENDQGRKADAMMDGISSWKSQGRGATLTTAVKRWTTPTAHNAKEGGFPAEHERNTPTLAAQAGGSLNPTWVEWLMGWPLGWTDLKPLATDKSPCVQPQHGTS